MSSTAQTLGILLTSGQHERAHYAFVLASGAASIGRRVILFAANAGCHALAEDWSALDDAGRDAAVRLRGIAGLGELRDAAAQLGVRMIACEAGLRMSGLQDSALAEGVETAGVVTFLEATADGQLVSL